MPKGTLYETWPPDHPALKTQVVIWIPTERQRRMYREWQLGSDKEARRTEKFANGLRSADSEVRDGIDSERTGREG